MDNYQFYTIIKEKVADLVGEGMTLQLCSTLKNNGSERIGLTIEDKHINIFPTIYLEEYYNQFLKGSSINSIAENILSVYHEVKADHSWQLNTLGDFTAIQSKIVYKLIHQKKNEKLLKTTPYIPYLDLAIVFYILLDVTESGSATILINNELLAIWDTDIETIHHIAAENSVKLLPANFKSMRAVINDLLGKTSDGLAPENDNMYVLTNSLGSFGAACILYGDMLKQIGERLGENYYVLPSSIHEVIIVPESKSPLTADLDEIVVDANETQVEPEEVLSDHAYYYDRAKNRLS